MTDILTRLAALTVRDANGLLPCPMCGGALYLHKVGNEHTKQRGWDSGCEKCRIHKRDRVIHQNHEWLLPKVVAAWNVRPREAALIALVQEAGAEIERLRNALHEGLNLCVRARKLDESITAKACRERGSYAPEHVKCGTPHLWVLEQYDNDLVAWEQDARKTLNVQGVIS